MSDKQIPTHDAYIVQDGERGQKAKWFQIAAVWTHKDGDGFDMELPPGVSVSGRIVIRKRKEKAEAEQEAA